MRCQHSTVLDVNTMIYIKLLNFTPDARCQHWLAAAYLQLTWPRQNRRVSNVKSTITCDTSTSSTWSAQWVKKGIFNMQRLILTSSTAYDNIIKGLRESGEISACRGKRADKQDKDPFDLLHFWFSSQTASKSYVLVQVCWKLSLQFVALFTNGSHRKHQKLH